MAHPNPLTSSANLVTFGRMLVIPLIVVCLLLQDDDLSEMFNRVMAWISALLFIFASVSDLIDGYLARRFSQVSNVGKLLDPLADKLVHMAVLVMLIPMHRMPAIIALIFITREVFITGLRGIAVSDGVVIGASPWAKRKTALINCGLSALLIHYHFWGINPRGVGWVVLSLALVVSIYSAVDYTVRYWVTQSRVT